LRVAITVRPTASRTALTARLGMLAAKSPGIEPTSSATRERR